MRRTTLGLLALLAWGTSLPSATAQVATGEIYGKVTDATGAVLPGVTVTLTSPVLLQPLTVATTETGSYRVPFIQVGTYTARFELAGFCTVVNEGIRVEIGLNAQINATMTLAAVQETVHVTASPLIDRKDAGKNNRFALEALQAVPSPRDPWAILEQSAGIAMDRQNVGGSLSGQQGNFVVRGAGRESGKWTLDGVDVTDMFATGSSPFYYDFDAFEEIQVTTGGADVAMQSAGVAINLVTKSGTDTLRGSARYYGTSDALQANDVNGERRRRGVYAGNPIKSLADYGLEAGGPIRRGRAWLWGAYGTNRLEAGINNFFKSDDTCQAVKADPLGYTLEETQACLMPDKTTLETYNLKMALQIASRNQFSFFFQASNKIRPTRESADRRPVETSLRQMAVARDDLGSSWWRTGIPKMYRWADRHVFSDAFIVEGQYAHVGANFITTFQDEALRNVQPKYETTTQAWSRSYGEDISIRPADIVELTGAYLVPGVLGGDHALKFGFKYRNDLAHRESTWGGDAIAWFTNGRPAQAQIWRGSIGEYGLHNRAFYVQDSYTRQRVTINAGFRFDHQHDYSHAASVPATAFYGQPTYSGVYGGVTYTGQPFNQLPSFEFGGANPPVSFNSISPRAGVSLDLTGKGHTLLKLYFARYAGQLGAGTGAIVAPLTPAGATYVLYPWMDIDGDGYIQAHEIVFTRVPLAWTSAYDYRKPSFIPGSVDPQLSVDRASEIIVTVERQLARDLAVSASYVWRKYSNFRWNDRTDWTSDDYVGSPYQPANCVPTARCPAVTYFNPVRTLPTATVLTNQPDYWRGYQGIELTARRRLTNAWMLNASVSYNDTRAHYDSRRAYEDPTNIENLDGAQYAPQYAQESSIPGLPAVLVNAKWIGRVSGTYRTPLLGINVAGFFDSRSGYPFIAGIQTPIRPNGAGTAYVYLDELGSTRLPTMRTLDLRFDRRFKLGRVAITPAIDVFNLLNASTPLSIHPVQNASNANQVSSIVPPRVIRAGFRAEW